MIIKALIVILFLSGAVLGGALLSDDTKFNLWMEWIQCAPWGDAWNLPFLCVKE